MHDSHQMAQLTQVSAQEVAAEERSACLAKMRSQERILTLQTKPLMSVEQALQSTLAHFRSPCRMPLKCMYSTPYTISSRHFNTHSSPLQ